MDLLLHAQQLRGLTLEQAFYGHAGPARDDAGDVLFADFFLQQLAFFLQFRELFAEIRLLLLQFRHLAKTHLRSPCQITYLVLPRVLWAGGSSMRTLEPQPRMVPAAIITDR